MSKSFKTHRTLPRETKLRSGWDNTPRGSGKGTTETQWRDKLFNNGTRIKEWSTSTQATCFTGSY